MRNPSEVATAIAQVVPDEDKERFEWLARDLSFKAPEQAASSFQRIGNMVNSIILKPFISEDWQFKTVALLMDISENEARTRFGK